MSGGHWDFDDRRAVSALQRISEDEEICQRFPKLAAELDRLRRVLGGVLHSLDWDLSADESIEDDAGFEKAAVYDLRGKGEP